MESTDIELRRRSQQVIEEIEVRYKLPRPVRVNGVDFQVITDKVWKVPKPGKETKIKLGLQFTNRSKGKQSTTKDTNVI